MSALGRGLLILGCIIATCGLLILLLGKLGFRGLPGDIDFRAGNIRVYVPIVSCIALSILLSLGMWFVSWMGGR